ncbi:MAG: DNA mismatch repair endonuclease MutL [Flavobacteriales bacterium]|jgi:DNA mismatch repair protein MutL|nr:DNA mismatch repair endonuclease MutL [Flavobacteriales bacterium]
MSNIIQLLPDHIANQIAAGEVIQRPASVVKELMENAVDAQSSKIQLIVKDAGRTLIQVVDNGLGMNESDARMCFERHATSKIKKAEDLFHLSTKGFRGEALASIAAVAHVELKTKQASDELGRTLVIEGSEILKNEEISFSKGSSFSVKNLFYNIPARRNFLKKDRTEFRFILDEFYRIALSHPQIQFELYHNDKEMYRLPATSFRQRIVNIFGKKFNQRLVPIEEETEVVTFSGFVTKPEFARKTRGEQYFFVNKRFIKNHYLHHAILTAFEKLMPDGLHPSYFIFIEVPAESIDVNIHPTKTEIKFENDQVIYSILKSCIRKSLGKFNIAPSLDFTTNQDYVVPHFVDGSKTEVNHPTITVDPSFNPFAKEQQKPKTTSGNGHASKYPTNTNSEQQGWKDWQAFLQVDQSESKLQKSVNEQSNKLFNNQETDQKLFQLHQKYIVSPTENGFLLIDQKRAHEKILFEQFRKSQFSKNTLSQQLLFSQHVDLSIEQVETLRAIKKEIENIGFDIGEITDEGCEVLGVPYDTSTSDIELIIEQMLDDYHSEIPSEDKRNDRIAALFAKNMSIHHRKELHLEEMNHLVKQLMRCPDWHITPNGKKTFVEVNLHDLEKQF